MPTLLAELPLDRSVTHIIFDVAGKEVRVRRALLSRARQALKRFSDLRAWIDSDQLCLRWHEGRGGLNLRSAVREKLDESRVLRVNLTPVTAVEQPQPIPPPARRPQPSTPPSTTHWLSETLSDLLCR